MKPKAGRQRTPRPGTRATSEPKTQTAGTRPRRAQALTESELRYRRLFEASQDGILILDAKTGLIEDVNPYLVDLLGYSRREFVKKKLWEVGAFSDIEASKDAFEALQENEYIRYEDLPLKAKDGRLIQVEFVSNVYEVGDEKVIQCDIRDVTEHKRIIAALQRNEKKYHDLVNHSPDGMFIIELPGRIETVNKRMCQELGFTEEEFLSMSFWDLIPEQYLEEYRESLTRILERGSLWEILECEVRGKDGRLRYVEVLSAPHYAGKDIIGFYGIARDLTERKQAAEKLEEERILLRTLIDSLPDRIYVMDREGRKVLSSLADWQAAGVTRLEDVIGKTDLESYPHELAEEYWAVDQQVMNSGAAVLNYDEHGFDPTGKPVWLLTSKIPLKDGQGRVRGLVGIGHDITERKRAEERIERQLRRLSALRTIDQAISSSFDVNLSLNILLAQAVNELGVDAAAVLLLNNLTNELEYAVGVGFRNRIMASLRLKLEGSYAGQAVLENHMVSAPDLSDPAHPLTKLEHTFGDKFAAIYAVPLVAKGRVMGVLEVFHRTRLDPEPDWLDFLETLAGQAAIAIDSGQLLSDLQRSNTDLSLAYDSTIEGWSAAMDLRDKETEGHTQRVTGLVLDLARVMGLPDRDLTYVRRGALLHDIGKMGVPDAILLKPGPLTAEEWVIMRQHPTVAYEMLSRIRYLEPAIDIPYCHHEKWDGTGYPRGLKGEEIPATARMFAVIDVYDAMTSDRPYRAAWSAEKAQEYIRSESGKHFEPRVVEAFLNMLAAR